VFNKKPGEKAFLKDCDKIAVKGFKIKEITVEKV